jgi:hypothetical protein
MKGRTFTLLATVVSLVALPLVVTAGMHQERRNLIGGELGGRGLILTLNYERFVSNDMALGAGFMGISSGGAAVAVIPMYVSFVPGETHSPYLAGGVTLLTGSGNFQDWESTWLFNLSAGYQFTSAGGFFVRPMFTLLRPVDAGSGDSYIVWPGLTIGGSF